MSTFAIFVCSQCGGLLAARSDQNTKLCPYCGFRATLNKCKHVASADDAQEASAILKSLKRGAAEKRGSHPLSL